MEVFHEVHWGIFIVKLIKHKYIRLFFLKRLIQTNYFQIVNKLLQSPGSLKKFEKKLEARETLF